MLLLTGIFLSLSVVAQSIESVRINEIQVHNTDGFKDEYGQAGGWIELFNSGHGRVNIAGGTLKVNGVEYRIPKRDPKTLMDTKGYLVFFAAGTPDKGTFHTNFTLADATFVEFYDIDGHLIDAVRFNPAEMLDGVSYGWFDDHDGVERWMPLPATTPGGSNNTIEKISRAELFRQADPSVIILTITAVFVVAIALTLLFFVFKYMGNFHINAAKKKAAKKIAEKTGVAEAELTDVINDKKVGVLTNDALAAIAIALYKYSKDLRENEKSVSIINRASRVNSPWALKKHNSRPFPIRKR